MRRPVLLLGSLLTTVTAIALVAAALVLAQPTVMGDTSASRANVALVERFYAAANLLLASGDASAVTGLVASDFVAEPKSAVVAPGRAGLIEALRWRHDGFPGMRLAVARVQPSGADEVVAQAHAETQGGSFLGLPLPPQVGAWAPIEVWRIAGGKLVERWTGAPEAVRLRTMGDAVPAVDPANGPQTVVLARETFAPGDALALPDDGAWRLVAVTAGHLTVGAAAGAGTSASMASVVNDGEAGPIPAGTAATIRNETGATATALIVEVASSWPAGRPHGEAGGFDRIDLPYLPAPSPAGLSELLAVAPEVPLAPAGGVAVGTVLLATGSPLALPASPRVVLLAVDAGTIWVGTGTGDGMLVAESGNPAAFGTVRTARLGAGNSAEIAPHAATEWSVPPDTAAATVFVVTIATG